ncbi:MAG: Fpg/Nei family DNA glycosylase, partial [Actinomycetales bacterium]|nr:Fpg/Nei family DNA glycosylase [Actinomycetales bacterium]
MPEGHSIHRVALQLGADLVGRRLAASSPQGRFAAGAALLDGLTMVEAFAVGKHLLVGFAEDGGPWDG